MEISQFEKWSTFAGAGHFARLNLAAVDFTAPAAGFMPALFDEFLKAVEVALHAIGDDAEEVADHFHEGFRMISDSSRHLRPISSQRLEGDDAGVLSACGVAPGDASVRRLLDDVGVPLFFLEPDVGDPMGFVGTDLGDRLDSIHKHGEFFELSPLVVDRAQRGPHPCLAP